MTAVLEAPAAPTAPTVDAFTGRRLVAYTGTSDPRLGVDEQLDVIAADIAASPRTLQVALGPSEVGHPCPRRIAYALLGYPEKADEPWLPYIGTAVHEQVACAFRARNAALRAAGSHDRYLVEHPVTVVSPAGRPISGHLDLYDAALGEVTDHKVVGKTTLTAVDQALRAWAKAKAGGLAPDPHAVRGVDPGYRRQIGLYAYGLVLQGYQVDRVRISYLPRNDPSLRRGARAYVADVTHDELAEGTAQTLARYDQVADGVEQLGPAVLAQLPAVEAHCSDCPFFTPGSSDPMAGCSGAEGVVTRAASSASRQLDGLIPA